MNFPSFDELRPMDILNREITASHFSAYLLLKTLYEKKFPPEDGNSENTNLQIITCESLTAGLIFSTLVDVPFGGKLKYGSFSVYDTDAKRTFCGVNVDNVYTHLCASQMAVGALINSNATLAIAVTGNAMPYQSDTQNMKQLGEIFIGIACYGKTKKILTETRVYNVCKYREELTSDKYSNHRICSLFYNTVEEENKIIPLLEIIKKQQYIENTKSVINPTDLEQLQKTYTGFNDFEITSYLSNFIRHRTVTQACQFAIDFVTKHNDKIICPQFIQTTKESMQSKFVINKYSPRVNSKLNDDRDNYVVEIINANGADITRISDGDTYNSLEFTGGSLEKYKKKYDKYKQKYLQLKKKN